MYNYNPYQYYQPPQPQPQNLLPPQQIMQTNGRPTFEAFKMSPNSSILLADTTAPIVWKCTTDGLGNVRNVQVLSSLYTIRENFSKSFVPTVYKMPELKGSELNEAVSDIQIYDLLEILNEHMEVVKALMPKEYQAVIDKIREAK